MEPHSKEKDMRQADLSEYQSKRIQLSFTDANRTPFCQSSPTKSPPQKATRSSSSPPSPRRCPWPPSLCATSTLAGTCWIGVDGTQWDQGWRIADGATGDFVKEAPSRQKDGRRTHISFFPHAACSSPHPSGHHHYGTLPEADTQTPGPPSSSASRAGWARARRPSGAPAPRDTSTSACHVRPP
ncbi:hypothetical protein VTJ49DRAFT_5075 [Mycothermus thermophilus]|uniref:Uncharacterized protein n=1 Tax=Humicola insolens TaxID=85995 RepID=A0ABR3V4V1_HUMIN